MSSADGKNLQKLHSNEAIKVKEVHEFGERNNPPMKEEKERHETTEREKEQSGTEREKREKT